MTENDRPRVLIVDDVPANLNMLFDALEPEGYRVFSASNGLDALRIAGSALPDIVLLDVVMPEMDGYEVCRTLKEAEETRRIPVIFITVKDDNTSLVEGFKAGGVDYITKPFEKEELLIRVENHLKISHLTQELLQKNEELRQEMDRREQEEKARRRAEDALQKADDHLELISQQEAARWGIDGFVGKSSTIKGILDEVHQLQSARGTSVLIVGESGTGKELIARAIHFGGERAGGPFIPVNCSAIPRDLAESLLFGHVRGAFTGADRSRKGYFELADGGTLFLDEIGDMPPELQPKLLRVLEDGYFMPLGEVEETHVDARIIAATNQDLLKKSSKGAFREDLFFRLAHITVTVPPLRERKEDIPLLAKHFLRIFSEEMRIPQPVLSPEASKMLEDYRFPGNVRELKSIIEYALLKSDGGPIIMPEHLHFLDANAFPAAYTDPPVAPQEDQPPLDLGQLEQLVIKRARKTTGGQDEEKILAHVREHGSINNAECRELLSVNKRRANYLLQKLCRYGLLVCKGELRWARYTPPDL